MAEDLGTLYWKVKADTSELDRAEASMDALGNKAKTTGKDADKLGKDVTQAGKKSSAAAKEMEVGFEGAAKSIKKVGAFLAAWGVTRIVSDTIKTTADFGKAISNLSAITGATGKDLQFYSDQAKEIGRTTSLSASQAAEGFKLIASAKPDLLASAESLAAVTREAVTLAEAAGIGLPDAAKAIGSALNQFQMPAEKANEVINVLAASAQLGTAEITSVTEAMRNAGSAANSLGLDFAETVAGIQALAASGREGADAGTALRQVLLKLEATGDQQLQPSIVGLVGALDQLKSMNLDNTQLMDLFGQEAFTAATSLLAQSDVAKQLNETMRGTNVATEQAAVNMDNLSGDYLQAKSAVEALQIELGEKLEPAMRSAAQSFADMTNEITDFVSSEEFPKWMGRAGNAIEIVSIALLARLAPSLLATSSGFAAATYATVAYEAAVLRLAFQSGVASGAQYSLATASGVAGKAMALFGGPAGILAIGAYGFYKWAEATREASGDTRTFTELLEAQYKTMVKIADHRTNVYLAGMGVQIDAQEEMNHVTRGFVGPMQAMTRMTEGFVGPMQQAAAAVEETTESILTLSRVAAGAAAGALGNYVKATEDGADANEHNQKSIQETITALENERISLGLTARAQAIFQAVTEATARGALPEQIARIAELTARNYDLAASTAAGEKAAEDWARTQEQATEAAQRQWEQTRDSLKGLILDYENLGETGKRILKELAAEWAASGLMNLMGMKSPLGAPGQATSGISSLLGSAGNTIGGTVAKTILGSLTKGAAGSASFVGPVIPGAAATAGGAAGFGGTVMSAIGAIPGWGWAAMGAAALAAVLNNDDGKVRSNAGFLVGPTPGAKSEYTFGTEQFSSGLNVQGFARRENQADAEAIIQQFRDIDAVIAGAVRTLGGTIDLSRATLAGLDEEARAGSQGTFLGRGMEGGDIGAQVNMFVAQLADHVGGLDSSLMAAIQSATSAEEVVRLLTEATDKLAANNAALAQKNELLDRYASEEQKLADAHEDIAKAFQKLNMAVPQSQDELYKLIETLDPLTESGAAAIAALGGLSGAISVVAGAAGGAAAAMAGASSFKSSTSNMPITSPFHQSIRDALSQGFIDGSHANGLNSVPFDGYIAQLHKGERVQTANEAANDDAMGGMIQGMKMQMAKHMALMHSIVQRWDQDGLPRERAV